MENRSIYQDIAMRTGGDIYLGLVGPGPIRENRPLLKSLWKHWSFPILTADYRRERAVDELPQSAAGKTIMNHRAEILPEEAVEVF